MRKVEMKPALAMTYASILNEEKAVIFLIGEGTDAVGLISEHVTEPDVDWNVDFYYSGEAEYEPVDGGFFTGNELEAVEYVVGMYNDWAKRQ